MKFLTIFPDFEDFHKRKDVGQVCVRMAKELDCIPHMLSYNKNLGSQLFCEPGNLNLIQIRKYKPRVSHRKFDINVFNFLIKESKKYKYLNLYHETFATQVYTITYKLLNPTGKVFIKLDLDIQNERSRKVLKENLIKRTIKKIVYKKYLEKLNLASVETIEGYNLIKDKGNYPVEKLIKMPNGFSDDYYLDLNEAPTYKEKRNIILTVGRVGCPDKNIDLLLKVLEKTSLKNWHYLIAGPISDEYKENISNFFIRNPEKIDSVEFLGNQNGKELYELYKRAKVFVLPSKKEGFPLVFPEALFFGCNILTTNVSSSMDVTKQGTIGTVVPIDNADAMHKELQTLIDNDVDEDMFLKSRELGLKEFSWDRIISNSINKLERNE
ncbi:glycosyltransferase family 4 protein [Vibrio sp. PNB22_4_2]